MDNVLIFEKEIVLFYNNKVIVRKKEEKYGFKMSSTSSHCPYNGYRTIGLHIPFYSYERPTVVTDRNPAAISNPIVRGSVQERTAAYNQWFDRISSSDNK